MKKYLISNEGRFFKAAMHVHTTISDGRRTISEVKAEHIKKGYQIVAFTDHEFFVPHNDLSDENFLAINSTEISLNHPDMGTLGWGFAKTCHLNMYAKRSDIDYLSVCTESYYSKRAPELMTERMRANRFDKSYSTESINRVIAAANADDFLVSYCHPYGCLHNYEDYISFKGLWGVECFNFGSYSEGTNESDRPLEDLLSKGENVMPMVGDDSHDLSAVGHCFTMIKSTDLKYENVMNALEKGDFYSSSGPEIHELYIEDGFIHIKCSPVIKINVKTNRRAAALAVSNDFTNDISKPFSPLTEAVIDLNPINEESKKSAEYYSRAFFRLILTDERGSNAYTKAYKFSEMFE